MSILRALPRLDAGEAIAPRAALDMPEAGEDILSVTDHWLSTLARAEEDANALINQIEENITRQRSAEQNFFDIA